MPRTMRTDLLFGVKSTKGESGFVNAMRRDNGQIEICHADLL